MADKFFVDTNILISAHARSAGIKHERACHAIERLWTTGQGVLSTQILQELGINLRHKLARPLPGDGVRRLIQDYLSGEIVGNSPEAVLQSLEIEMRYKISFWDAFVLQAAEQSGAAVLYSEALAAGQHLRPGSGDESAAVKSRDGSR